MLEVNKKICIEDSIRELSDFYVNSKENKLYRFILEIVEKPLLEMVLEKTGGNQLKAAKILGINRNTIRAKIKKLGIDVKKWKDQI